ncbi:hypothetical protein [Streptomyces monomycini]|uniref:hypothetical protein n=1 Tax=Streptomyces monomycini TaxID=371720 RepID=UPI0004AA5274|nr:hypothetical protein [Streptomyces monomycini]
MQPDRPDQPPRPGLRHRFAGRTRPLIALGAALGVVGGVAAGYAVQYGRPPTPLPPLAAGVAAQQPRQTAGDAVPRPVAAPWSDGDLETLLAPRPEDARPQGSGNPRLRLDGFAAGYTEPAEVFKGLVTSGFQRAVHDIWCLGSLTVRTDLVQFRDMWDASAARYVEDGQGFDETQHAHKVKLAGTPTGVLLVEAKAREFPGSAPLYTARALARRGTVVMDMAFQDTKPLDEAALRTLAQRQLDTLMKAPAQAPPRTMGDPQATGPGAAALRTELLPAPGGLAYGPDPGSFRNDSTVGAEQSELLARQLSAWLPAERRDAFFSALRRRGVIESAVRTYRAPGQILEVQLLRLKPGGADGLPAALAGDGVRTGPSVPGHPEAHCVLPEGSGAKGMASMLCAGQVRDRLVVLTAYGPEALDTSHGARHLSQQLQRTGTRGGTA